MLDIRLIREEPEKVRRALTDRGLEPDIEPILELDRQRRALLADIEQKRAERNAHSDAVGRLMRDIGLARKAKQPTEEFEEEVATRKEAAAKLGQVLDRDEEELRPVDAALQEVLLTIPNIPDESVPVGVDERDNPTIRTWGEPPAFAFEPLPHWDLADKLGIIDFERASKIAGARFALYLGAGAQLERALINLMLDLHSREHGYREVWPPVLVNSDSMRGTGQLPKFEEDLFRCRDDDLWLIPTAEVPVTNIHRDEVLPEERLPIKYAAYTPCFRREAGAYGRETRGVIRQHQFNKVELVKFVRPETAGDELESLTANAAKVLEVLGLPYRIIALCSGDLGFSAAKTYDIEVWMPGIDGYKEISSCSNFGDFQARRASIRYRPKGGKPRFVHTLNGSGLAVGRTVAAIMENFQQEDGTIVVPEALRRYLTFDCIVPEA